MGMTGYLIDNTRPRKITIGEKQYTEHEVLTAIIINQKDLFVVLGQIPE